MHPPPETLSMTHEEARRPVSRLWLRAFAGIVAVLFAAPSAAADDPGAIAATELHPWAAFGSQSGRNPTSVFLTDLGVYELDRKSSNVMRIWQRSDDGMELFRPKNESTAVPMEAGAAQASGALRFSGKDANGGGTQFKQPVGMDREPGGTRFAVVNAGEWIERGNNRFCPSVQVYSFAEEEDSGGALSGVEITFENEYKESFYTMTNGAEYVVSNIVDTSYFTTNLLELFFTTNWIHVTSTNPYRAVTNELESADAIMLISTNRWEEEVYHSQLTTNYMWRYTYTTNANYLSTATDVAFLGSSGVMVSMTADERRTMPSGFIVFDLSDPSAKGAIYPVSDLPGVIRKIAVDPQTGDVYATVPDAGAVYRFRPPGDGPGSWVTSIVKTDDIGVWRQPAVDPEESFVAGVVGEPGSAFGKLSSPGDLCVWYPSSLDEAVVLVADTDNNRIEAFDCAGTALFTFGGTSAKPFDRPQAVWGDPGTDEFAVSEYSGSRVRIFEPDLSGVDADFILSLGMVWPASMVDLSIADGHAFVDAIHTNAVDSGSLLVVESDDATNVLRFVVPPSREARSYTLSVAGGAGVVDPVSATATVEPGETEGFFAFYAKDGVVNDDGSIPVYLATVTAPSGKKAEAYVAVLNARPTIVTAGMDGFEYMGAFITTSFSVDATDVVADSALSYFWFATTNFNWGVNHLLWAVDNREAFENAGSDWSRLEDISPPPGKETITTNWVDKTVPHIFPHEGRWNETEANGTYWIDYGGTKHGYTPYVVTITNDVVVTNYFWISVQYSSFRAEIEWVDYEIPPPSPDAWTSEYASWIDLDGEEHHYRPWDDYNGKTNFFTIKPRYASFFDAQTTTTGDTVTNGIFVYVAKGKEVLVPECFSFMGYPGMAMEDDVSNMGGIIVLAVVDKDGGAAIVRFGKDYDSQDSEWTPGASGGGEHENGAVYEGEFIAIEPTSVSFVVRVKSGTADDADTVSLKSAEDFRQEEDSWALVRTFRVGRDFLGGATEVTNASPIQMSKDVLFYRVFQP
jgi:hypothetical protein